MIIIIDYINDQKLQSFTFKNNNNIIQNWQTNIQLIHLSDSSVFHISRNHNLRAHFNFISFSFFPTMAEFDNQLIIFPIFFFYALVFLFVEEKKSNQNMKCPLTRCVSNITI